MIEVSFLSLLILGELVLILSLACGLSLFMVLRKRKRDYQAARKLVAAVKQDEERHEKLLSQRLESDYGYEGAQLEETVAQLLRAKKYYYQRLIDAYLKRDAAAFGQLNIPLDELTDHYEQFKVPATSGGSEGEEGLVSEVDLEYLRDKNQRLSEELSQTMETMGRMLTEYSSIFDEASNDTDDEDGMTDITGDGAPSPLDEAGEAIAAASAGIQKTDKEAGEASLEALEGAVEGLLEDVEKQAENDLPPPAEEPEAIAEEQVGPEDDSDEIQMADEQDLSDAFEDLEEIDIEGDIDILSPEEDGGDMTRKTPAEGGG